MLRHYSSKCIKKKKRKIYLMLPLSVLQFVQRENLENNFYKSTPFALWFIMSNSECYIVF